MPPATSRRRGRIPRCGWSTLAHVPDSRPSAAPTRVAPTRRLAHYLRARHDEQCLAQGLTAWSTPDIVTWDELVERMFVLDRQAGRLDARWLPSGAAQLLWERIVAEDPATQDLVSIAGVGRSAAASWRRLHDYHIPLEALDRGDSPETQAFARWCRGYRRMLETRGWLDVALAQSRVHGRAAEPGLELVGFDHLTPLQESLLERWAGEGVAVVRVEPPRIPSSVGRVSCLDETAEIDAAARWAAALLDGDSARRVAIVVSDLARRRDAVRRIIERVLVPGTGLTGGPAPEAQAFELAAARPLAEQPVVVAALDLLELFVRIPDLSGISELLRNPFLSAAQEERDARARLDARLRRFEGPGFGLRALEHRARARGCPGLADALAAGREEMSKWHDKDLPSSCSKNIFDFLTAVGWPGSALASPEHQAAERWRSLVSELGTCDEYTGRVSRAEAIVLLRDLAGRTLFEPQELRAPLLVIDPETCAGMTFDAVWVCGLDAARWPFPAVPDPFLPRAVQVTHGLPGASSELAAQDARRVLERLLRSGDEVVLSAPEMDDDAPLLPSPLLAGIESWSALPQWPAPRLSIALHATRPTLEEQVDGELPGVDAEASRRGGARLLELQAACPFRAQAEFRLGARALEEPGVGVDAAERGDLLHVSLATLWRELGSHQALQALDATSLRERVRRCIEHALVEARRSADDVLRHLLDLEAEWLESRVLEMVEHDRARPPFTVLGVEQPCTARIGPLTLELRPDRVDRLADGSLAVLDYKTGANAEVRAWLDERPRLPQLPAYVQALGAGTVGAVAFARARSGDTGYAGLARDADAFPGLKAPGARGWPREYASWEELLGAWRRRLEALAEEFAAGDARLAPDPSRACEYCHLGMLCRIAETGSARDAEDDAHG